MLFLGTLQAQNSGEVRAYGDSVYRKISDMPEDEKKAKALLELSFFWSDYDTAQAFMYIREAAKLMDTEKDSPYQLGLLSFYRAAVHFDTDPQQAKTLYMLAERHLSKVKTEEAMRCRIRLWSSYGALRQRDGEPNDYVDALINQVIPLATAIKDTALLGNNYQNVAMALMNMQKYKEADQYYKRAIAMLGISSASDEHRLTAYVNAARNAVFQRHLKQAEKLLSQAYDVFKRIPLSTYGPIYHAVYGSYWKKRGNWKRAFEQFDLGLARARALNSDEMIASVLFDQYETYKEAGRLPEAKEALLEVLPYVEKSAIWRNKQRIYYNLANVERDLGNFESSSAWFQKYAVAVDTLMEDTGEARIMELERKYQTAEKEKELSQTREINQRQQLSLVRTQTWTIILSLCCLLLIAVGAITFITFRNRKRNENQKARMRIFEAVAQGEEQERSRVARDLHDGLGGVLAAIKLKLSAIVNQRDSTAHDISNFLNNLIQDVDYSVDEVRRVARNMMPESLRSMGLEAALGDLCKSLQHDNLQIDFAADNISAHKSTAFLISVYRIVQELLTNMLKHSQATHAWVQCSERDGEFYLSVEDNGIGFLYTPSRENNSGMGIQNIKNRMDMLQGKWSIDTAPGEGVSIHISIPLHDHRKN